MTPWPLSGPNAAGPLLVLDHLRTLVVVAAFVLLLVAVGRRLLRRWPATGETPTDALVYSFLVGCGAVGVQMLVLGWIGLLRPVPILCAVAGFAVWTRGEMRGGVRLMREGVSALLGGTWGGREEGRGWIRVAPRTALVGIVGLGAAFLVARALLPPADWDSIMYHLPIPLDFLGAGAVVLPEDNMAVYATGLMHLLWTPLLVLASPSAVQLLNVVFLALLALSVFTTGLRFLDRWAGAIAVAVLMGTTMIVLVAETARVDTSLALWLWAGQLGVVMLGMKGWDRGWALRVVMVLGFAIGVKNQTLAFGLALAPIAIWAVAHHAPTTRAALRRIGAMGAGAVVLGAPWIIAKLALVGSTVYPTGAEAMLQPWLAELFPAGAGVPDDIPRVAYARVDGLGALREFVLTPWRMTVESEAAFYRLSPLLLALPLTLLDGRRWRTAALLVPSLGFLLIVVVVLGKSAPRYVIASFPALAMATGVGCAVLLERIEGSSLRRVMGAALLMLGVSPLLTLLPILAPASTAAWALGLVTPRASLESRGLGGLLRLDDRLREELEDAGRPRVVLIGEARGLYLPPAVLVDVSYNWPRLRRTPAASRCLVGTGIGYLVVARANVDFFTSRAPADTRWGEMDTFRAFADRCLGRLDAPDGYELYRVRPGGA